MGFFDKGVLGQMKDMVTKGPNGIFNEAAREQLPLANTVSNPDGTMNAEAMAKLQEQSRDALSKAGGMSFLGKKFIQPDVLAGFQQMQEDAFKRQNVMMDMMNDYQRNKAASTGEAAATAPASVEPGQAAQPRAQSDPFTVPESVFPPKAER